MTQTQTALILNADIECSTKVYARESTAKGMATKMTKKAGVNHVAKKVEGGWIVKVLSIALANTAAKTNVPGRCSGGNWLNQATRYILSQASAGSEFVLIAGEKKNWISVDGLPLFWTFKTERATAILNALNA